MGPQIMGKELILWISSYFLGKRNPKGNSSAISSEQTPSSLPCEASSRGNFVSILKKIPKEDRRGSDIKTEHQSMWVSVKISAIGAGQTLRQSVDLENQVYMGSFGKVVKGDELVDKVWFRRMYSMLGKYKRVTVWVL